MADWEHCTQCGAQLYDDDIAIYRKLVYRAAEEFCCRDCLAKQFGCQREKIDRLIRYYRESGECTLFR